MGIFDTVRRKISAVIMDADESIKEKNGVDFYRLAIKEADDAIKIASNELRNLEAGARVDGKKLEEKKELMTQYSAKRTSLKSAFDEQTAKSDVTSAAATQNLAGELVGEMRKLKATIETEQSRFDKKMSLVTKQKQILRRRKQDRDTAAAEIDTIQANKSMIDASSKCQAAFADFDDNALNSSQLSDIKRRQEESMAKIDIVDEESTSANSFEDRLSSFDSSNDSKDPWNDEI